MRKRWQMRAISIPSLDMDDDDLGRLARVNAQDNFSGPPDQEPVVALLLTEIQARARKSFVDRSDMRHQQQHRAETNAARDRAEEDLGRIVGEREYGSGDEAAGRRSERRVADRHLGRAEVANTSQEISTRTLENQVIDEIGAEVERLLAKPRGYLAAFNGWRAYEGRPLLDPLPETIVNTIMSRVVRSPLAEPRAGSGGPSAAPPGAPGMHTRRDKERQ